jgi:hypothetical protein
LIRGTYLEQNIVIKQFVSILVLWTRNEAKLGQKQERALSFEQERDDEERDDFFIVLKTSLGMTKQIGSDFDWGTKQTK